MFTLECLRGECCERVPRECTRPVEVPYTALYSRNDGIVNFTSCLDPAAHEQVEVRASHFGMALNAEVYGEIAHALGRLAASPGGRDAWAQAA